MSKQQNMMGIPFNSICFNVQCKRCRTVFTPRKKPQPDYEEVKQLLALPECPVCKAQNIFFKEEAEKLFQHFIEFQKKVKRIVSSQDPTIAGGAKTLACFFGDQSCLTAFMGVSVTCRNCGLTLFLLPKFPKKEIVCPFCDQVFDKAQKMVSALLVVLNAVRAYKNLQELVLVPRLSVSPITGLPHKREPKKEIRYRLEPQF